MLRELRIANVAIIDALALSFAPGLNVLTGETGAGKSIIMRSLGLLCGERATPDMIRTDTDEAEIEGLFELEPAKLSPTAAGHRPTSSSSAASSRAPVRAAPTSTAVWRAPRCSGRSATG